MKISLLILFFYAGPVHAQFPERTETPFNRFVKHRDIEWAFYADDTLKTASPDLRKILIEKMKAKKIRVAENMLSGTNEESVVKYRPAEEILSGDETLPKGLLNVYQILYLKRGKLLSYISRVAPLADVTTTAGLYLGRSEYFTTAINKKYCRKFSSKKNVIFLTQTNREIYADSLKKEDILKETFGRNFAKGLVPGLTNRKAKIYDAVTGIKLSEGDIRSYKIPGETEVHVPVYDSVGGLAGTERINVNMQPMGFHKMKITQDWYYHSKKNMVFSKIRQAYLYAYTEKEIQRELLRIVF